MPMQLRGMAPRRLSLDQADALSQRVSERATRACASTQRSSNRTVAAVMLVFALLALFAPAIWHRRDVANSLGRQESYAAFAAEFLDSIQGLATLKAFGQSKARGDKLEHQARDLFQRTMWVLGTNVAARGITDSSIACGAAAALALGAWRVETGAMGLTALLVILMLGVEIYRPMRELRSVLHRAWSACPRPRASIGSWTTSPMCPMRHPRRTRHLSLPISPSRMCPSAIRAPGAGC